MTPKKKFLLIIYFMWAVPLWAQSTYFDKYFATPNLGDDEGNSVIELPGGNYLVCGAEFNYPSFFLRALIIKINSDGDTLWSKIISTDTVGLNPIIIKQTKPNEFIVGGNAQIVKNNHINIFNMSIDSNGNINWLKYVEPPHGLNAAFEQDIVISKKGEIIDIGDISDTSYGFDTSLAYVVKNDGAGNVIWQKTFGGAEFTDTRAFSGIESNTGYIIDGVTTINNNFEVFNGYLIGIDTSGNFLWQKIYGTKGKQAIFYDIIKLFNNNYLLPGSIQVFQNNNFEKNWLVQIDSSGNLLSQKFYGDDSLETAYLFRAMTVDDSEIVLIGGENHNGEPLNGSIMKIKQNEDTIWKHLYHYPNDIYDDYFYGFQQTSDSGFIITGDCHPNVYRYSVWLLKLDQYGCDSVGCSQVTGINQLPLSFSFSIYPNPATSILHVMLLSKHEAQQPTFTISNMLGQNILPFDRLRVTNGNEYNFDVSSLSADIYFLTIKTSERELTEKFVKE